MESVFAEMLPITHMPSSARAWVPKKSVLRVSNDKIIFFILLWFE